MKYLKYILVLIFFMSANIYADSSNPDSIINTPYYNSLNNYNKAKFLINTSKYRLARLDYNVFHLLDTAGDIIKSKKYIDLEYELYMCNGLYWKYTREYGNSINYYLKALGLVNNSDKMKTAEINIALGETYRAAADKKSALKKLYKAEFIITQSNNNPEILAEVYNRIAAVYYQFSKNDDKYKNRCTSKSYLEKSILLLQNNPNYKTLIDAYITLGAIYRDWDDSAKSMEYFDKAQVICDKYRDSSFTIYNYATLMVNKAYLYYNFNNLEEAINCILCLNEFNKEKNITVTNGSTYSILSDIYKKMTDYINALYYKDLEYNFYINQNYESKNRVMLELEARYKNNQIEKDLKNKNEVTKFQTLAIIIGLLLVVISAYMFRSRHNALKKKQELIEQQNDELVKLNATKDKFFSILAHDLKNPIFGISTLLDIVQGDVENNNLEDLKHNIKLLNSNSKHVSELLGSLLTWARSQRGLITYYPIKISIGYVVKSNIELLSANASNKSIEIVDNSDDNHYVTADANMLITIVRNLLSNAIKFTPENGKITIKSEIEGNDIITSISDTGIGIPQEILETLFSIDKSSHRLGTNNETGTGLGLILCQEFIQKMSGKIWVESIVSQGTVFYFSLPISE